MLINFTIQNYKSYKNDTKFSMEKAPRLRDLSHSLLTEKINSKEFHVLCSSVLYGPNASGKSNIIDAMFILRSIILSGNIKNNFGVNLELVPFIFDGKEQVKFNIEFIKGGNYYSYYLQINVGSFLDNSYNRTIEYEKLDINFKTVYERHNNYLNILSVLNEYKEKFTDEFDINKMKQMFTDTLVEDSIFLTNGFKTFSKYFSQEIISWFEADLIIIPKLNDTFSHPILKDQKIYIDSFVNEIAKQSGISGSDIAYIKDDVKRTITTASKITTKNNKSYFIPVEIIESFGTSRIIQLMPIILDVLKRGAVFVVDELDVALHPMVMMNIINIFHNDEVNKNKAQIIFNTHNPIYLNNSILRRDEIKFVEKDIESHESILYSLSDFGTKGENSVRNTTDYMKNYFMNKYGAIIQLDYTDIIKNAIERGKSEKN